VLGLLTPGGEDRRRSDSKLERHSAQIKTNPQTISAELNPSPRQICLKNREKTVYITRIHHPLVSPLAGRTFLIFRKATEYAEHLDTNIDRPADRALSEQRGLQGKNHHGAQEKEHAASPAWPDGCSGLSSLHHLSRISFRLHIEIW